MKGQKEIAQLLKGLEYELVQGDLSQIVSDIQLDSRKLTEDSLFIAIKGTVLDAHKFIPKAIELGAKSIILEDTPEQLVDGITYIKINSTSQAAGIIAANFFDNPSEKVKVVAVTGTNGKTTVVTLLQNLFIKLGYNTGALTTIENKINDEIIPTKLTTPDPVTLQFLLSEMVKKNCSYCFMEASSHAIVQGRLQGINLEGAIFSNISHDHLDYHGTMKEYINAKKRLFDTLPKKAFALVNIDDKRGNVMLQNCRAKHYSFGLHSMANFKGKLIDNTFEGIQMDVNGHDAWFQLIGSFNAYNVISAYATAICLGEDEFTTLQALSELKPAKGRFEQIVSKNNIRGIIDYAHTPDALENVLETIRDIREEGERIITVIGCGGDRDATKRPIMAKTAAMLSEEVILTSDNPRTEKPEDILDEMEDGISPTQARRTQIILDRREAIQKAVEIAEPRDIILLAGKGHETYQEINGVRHHFDDKEELFKAFN
ncbi:UDP-N-acetylmuramoyl-L-alanyl-D-glutamate--2,6-diaminopimelate ligase [Flammeovirga kamogawensis]|uniref:UDP-N-acetylmuramoyl-L-alanyl-D-glutamate--2, 6-diaminopimelate ligase n=1 Tax=Flammeovirga kamogawensis TaxID=373891 RepID=UPI0017BFE641|nr:UDP-N-acetylmuramoyl-L-alanyl-D-glutamate--2,6-diaminopimelate ligase [Flammeovirga kamogawensis]MBB6459602.1 UDP-N-acetylmuramoyl-L-alanyl-D-glutamate--2,6-diaminopimelate ligase [Flammeovirga kamogawensis]